VAGCSFPEGGVANCCCPKDVITGVEGEDVIGCTPSVCVVVEDRVGTTGQLLGGGGDDADEEEGRVLPCIKVRTRDGEDALDAGGGDATR
jgi:hypothetical protein